MNLLFSLQKIMSESIEALAMAGVDYHICNVDFEEWEHEDMEPPPPHLLAEEEEEVKGDGSTQWIIQKLKTSHLMPL